MRPFTVRAACAFQAETSTTWLASRPPTFGQVVHARQRLGCKECDPLDLRWWGHGRCGATVQVSPFDTSIGLAKLDSDATGDRKGCGAEISLWAVLWSRRMTASPPTAAGASCARSAFFEFETKDPQEIDPVIGLARHIAWQQGRDRGSAIIRRRRQIEGLLGDRTYQAWWRRARPPAARL